MQSQIKLGLVEFREDHTEPPFRKAHIRPIPAEIEAEVDAEDDGAADGEEEFATQVRGSYFYKQSQVAVKFLRKLLGVQAFNNPKDHFELARLFSYATADDSSAVVMDFFAGSGSSGHSVMELNQADGGRRRYVLVQLPEALDADDKDQSVAAKYCDTIGKPRTIAELTKERLRRAGTKKIREEEVLAFVGRPRLPRFQALKQQYSGVGAGSREACSKPSKPPSNTLRLIVLSRTSSSSCCLSSVSTSACQLKPGGSKQERSRPMKSTRSAVARCSSASRPPFRGPTWSRWPSASWRGTRR